MSLQIFVDVLVLTNAGNKLKSHSILKYLIAFFTVAMVTSGLHFRQVLYDYLYQNSPSNQDKLMLSISGVIPFGLSLILTIIVWVTPFDLDWQPVIDTGLGYCSVSSIFSWESFGSYSVYIIWCYRKIVKPAARSQLVRYVKFIMHG